MGLSMGLGLDMISENADVKLTQKCRAEITVSQVLDARRRNHLTIVQFIHPPPLGLSTLKELENDLSLRLSPAPAANLSGPSELLITRGPRAKKRTGTTEQHGWALGMRSRAVSFFA
jgi:hypothetical protein